MRNSILFVLLICVCSFTKHTQYGILQASSQRDFKLTYLSIGFGSNMFKMQPVFKINDSKFIYTSEEVWRRPNQKESLQKDTLLAGNIRVSSIDSILNIIKDISDTLIYKTNVSIMSGGMDDITISNNLKKVRFQLHNASDVRAKKIAVILNSYIPSNMEKLYLFE